MTILTHIIAFIAGAFVGVMIVALVSANGRHDD